MTDAPRPTTDITLLGRCYTIACQPEEQPQLERAAHYLDHTMSSIQAQGKLTSTEHIALMAALNIAHELSRATDAQQECERRLADLSTRLERALSDLPSR